MRLRSWRSPVGPRILKTALAVTLALAVVEHYGASPAKVVFATIGAMSAVGPTFTASLLACLTQICGVAVGGLLALTMIALQIPPVIGVGVGIVGILTGYQYFRLRLVPVLPCLVLVNACLNPAVEAAPYAVGRLWDTAIGLAIGMVVNMLIFPYDNSRKIRRTMEGLDRDLILFLEDLFDGDEHLPEAEALARKVDALEGQLLLFSQQRLLLHRARQKRELQCLRSCEDIARELVVGAGGPAEHGAQGPAGPGEPSGAAGAGRKSDGGGVRQGAAGGRCGGQLPCGPRPVPASGTEGEPAPRGQCPGKKPSERP